MALSMGDCKKGKLPYWQSLGNGDNEPSMQYGNPSFMEYTNLRIIWEAKK